MSDYRLYVYGDDEEAFIRPAMPIYASNDDDAIAEAATIRGNFAAELRDGAPLVKKFERRPRRPP